MKKIISFILVLSLLSSLMTVNVAAASNEVPVDGTAYKVEGETLIARKTNITQNYETYTAISSGAYTGAGYGFIYSSVSGEHSVSFSVPVTITKAGEYAIEVAGYVHGQETSIKAKAGENEITLVAEGNALFTTKLSSPFTANYSAKKYFGELDLDTGIKEIVITMTGTGGGYRAIFDNISIKNAKPYGGVFNLKEVSFRNSSIGVFSEGEAVTMELDFTAYADQPQVYRFEVKDIWGRKVSGGSIHIVEGMGERTVNLGSFKVGWYRVYIYKANNSEPEDVYVAFSVMHPLSARADFEKTSFAAGLAAEYDAVVRKNIDDFAKAFKLAGLSYVRNLGDADQANGDPEVKRVMHQHGINETSNYDGNKLGYSSTAKSPEVLAFTDDLYENGYKKWQKVSKANGGYAEAIEILNEIDIGFFKTTGTPDNFAAYHKAAAIGITDSTLGNPLKVFCGWAGSSEQSFAVWSLQNDIAKYSDIYNYHNHSNNPNNVQTAVAAANAYGDAGMSVWGTEIGAPTVLEKDATRLTDKQLRNDTSRVIKVLVGQIYDGCNKPFAYILRAYLENGKNFGFFTSPEYLPYPFLSSIGTLTYALGEGKVKGELAGLNSETTGYLFDDGLGNDVAVLWSKNQCYVEFDAKELSYIDMVGYEEKKFDEDNDGKIRISVSSDPIFVRFSGQASLNDYYPLQYNDTSESNEPKKFTVAERIVLNPVWSDVDPKNARTTGHYVYRDQENQIKLRVYNLNDVAVKGAIDIVSDDNIKINTESVSYALNPWEQTELIVDVDVNGDVPTGTSGFIKFVGRTDAGENLSNCVSKYYIYNGERTIKPEDMMIFDAIYDTSRWQLKNVGSGTKLTAEGNKEENSITFTVETAPGAPWNYPWYIFEDASILEGSSGIAFEIKNTGEKGYNGVYLHMKDGRQYFCGVANTYPLSSEWHQCVFPWSCFYLFSSPEGQFETKTLELSDIKGISIGGETSDVRTVRNYGAFYSDIESDKINSDKNIHYSGITENKHYAAGSEELVLTATLPDDEIISVKVFNGRDIIDDFKREENKVVIDFTEYPRGKYIIQVCAENSYNKQYTRRFAFYID